MPPASELSLLIKPASADCNLRCGYCFYLPKAALYPESRVHRMSPQVLERLVTSYLELRQQRFSFGWQGGEPTLMGLDFFRSVTALQRRGRPGSVVSNGLQTNATLVDDELARHLARYRFLVGVSIDGPPELHDAWRRAPGGAPSHARVMEGVEALRRHGVEHNVLTLVTPLNAARGGELYRYLRDSGFLFHQYIPCVELDGALRPAACTVGAREWGAFLCEVFDEWHAADTRRVSVRLFDSIIQKLVDGTANVCSMADDCRQYLLVEHNGDVYPCDFFVDPSLKLGNIMESGWEEIRASERYAEFGRLKARMSPECRSCPYLELCAGDCLKHRGGGDRSGGDRGGGDRSGAGEGRRLSYLCEGWKLFYAHALPELRRIAERLRRSVARQAPGRNDPCPCGSGKKYKACCGAR